MLKIDELEIQERYLVYGVREPKTGEVVIHPSEAHARKWLDNGTELVVRHVFETGWAVAPA